MECYSIQIPVTCRAGIEEYNKRVAAWKANGSPLDPEQAARARAFSVNGENHELLSTACEAESWIAAAIEEFRAKWGVLSRGWGGWVPDLIDGAVYHCCCHNMPPCVRHC